MQSLKALVFFALAACGGSPDIQLCDDPNGCTVTPTHPTIDFGSAVDQHKPAPIKVPASDEVYAIVPMCDVGGVQYACMMGAPNWTYWPDNDPHDQPGVACNVAAVQPVDGDLCYIPTIGLYGVVHLVNALQ